MLKICPYFETPSARFPPRCTLSALKDASADFVLQNVKYSFIFVFSAVKITVIFLLWINITSHQDATGGSRPCQLSPRSQTDLDCDRKLINSSSSLSFDPSWRCASDQLSMIKDCEKKTQFAACWYHSHPCVFQSIWLRCFRQVWTRTAGRFNEVTVCEFCWKSADAVWTCCDKDKVLWCRWRMRKDARGEAICSHLGRPVYVRDGLLAWRLVSKQFTSH